MQNRRKKDSYVSIPEKANVVLNLILIAFVIIGMRIWHLSVIQYEEKFEQSKKTQRKTIIEPAKRATIRDRFNMPLAYNKIAYSAGITYSPIRSVPAVAFEADDSGKKVKKFKRKEYISQLSRLLADELHLDEKRVEDLIYSKAALYFNVPYIFKYEITESQYYRLKMLEKDWPGLTIQRYSKREYPKSNSMGDIIGYMGAISREEYEKVILEKKALEKSLNAWENGEDLLIVDGHDSFESMQKRHSELESLAYTAQDYVGKTGIEGLFEQSLRGFQGKRTFYSDSKGNFLKELPGSKSPLSGKRILLSISQELQEYAEILLAQNEEIRAARSAGHGKKVKNKKQPWIKGGAIVALEPSTGEVLALATYPRFNPNDFVSCRDELGKSRYKEINKWFENEYYIADLWNEVLPLEKELFNSSKEKFYIEKKWISWPNFLDMLLPKDHPIITWFKDHDTIEDVVAVLQDVDDFEKKAGSIASVLRSKNMDERLIYENHSLKKHLDFLPTPYAQLLFLDCCQIAVNEKGFSNHLLKAVGKQSLDIHKKAGGSFLVFKNAVKGMAKDIFHAEIFSRWRELNEKNFLKEKRALEKIIKTYPKPYLDYLDEKENELFAEFWDRCGVDFCILLLKGNSSYNKDNCFTSYFKQLHDELVQGAHPEMPWRQSYDLLKIALKGIPDNQIKPYLTTLRSYHDLNRPLKGKYRQLRNGSSIPQEKHLAMGIYPTYGYGYGRSYAFRQASTQGSIFKMVTAHEALLQVNEESLKAGSGIKNKNPLDMHDETFKMGNHIYVGYHASGKPISQVYKGGRVPRSSSSRLGKMDLLHAIETSSNPYFSLLAGDILKSPSDLAEAAKKFGFGKKTGIDLPGEISGKIPNDLETNRTGLYATAIGQHSLVVTPLQTAVFLSTFVNGGELLKPQVIKLLVGASLNEEEMVGSKEQQSLLALGIDFPLFNMLVKPQEKIYVEKTQKKIEDHVIMEPSLRNLLLEGMRRVVVRTHKESLAPLSRLYTNHPEAISDYIDLKNQIVGKTSTSESMERIDFDENEGTNLYTHVWFGGISFEKDVNSHFENPEMVVVVYLRYGSFGKETAPLAAQMVKKWREIKARHE